MERLIELLNECRQMEKLIELLNKHRREKVNKQSGITQWHYNGYTFSLDNLKAQQAELLIISKSYGFIKWLVENEKIEYRKIIEKEIEVGFKLVRIKDYPNKIIEEDIEELLMLLSIQDEPIEFLCNLLK